MHQKILNANKKFFTSKILFSKKISSFTYNYVQSWGISAFYVNLSEKKEKKEKKSKHG